jgi:hypothetical protein
MSSAKIISKLNVSDFTGLVIGPRGATIQALKLKYNLESCFVNNNSLILKGNNQNVISAKVEILQLIKSKKEQNIERNHYDAIFKEERINKKKLLKIERLQNAEAKLIAQMNQFEERKQPVYKYKGKFDFSDSDEERVDSDEERIELNVESEENPKTVQSTKPNFMERGAIKHRTKFRWADEESDDEK